FPAPAAIAVFGILAGAAQAAELADIKAAGEINIGIFSAFPPFSSASADMSIKGYEADVAQKIADGLGVKQNLVSVTG
ncbi:transporter substrate-binding domain-containing protein, partial [Rhizobium ruizarguesonis]